jgi:predicted Zn-dependent protease
MAKHRLATAGLLLAFPAMVYAQSSGAHAPAQTTNAPATAPAGATIPGATPTTVPAATTGPNDKNDQDKSDKKNKKDDAKAVPVAKPDAEVPLTAEVGLNGVVKGVKQGSLDDVSAVGTRDIGARGLGNWYSTNTEIGMGKEYSVELEKSTKFITDPVVTEYVNRVAQNLVKNSDARLPFTVKVIDSDEINAFALPGGFFYVNSGLILNADTEAELAGVMAHEISHVIAHHAMREQTRMNYAQIGTIPLIFVGGGLGYGIYEAANIGIPLTFLQFSRDFEAQADFLGTQYLYRAGYDPQALIDFFEKIENLEKQKPGLISRAFATHPETPDRIARTQEEIATLLPPREQYLETTSEFNVVKARLARIENKRKLLDKSNGNKPTLRKTTASDPNTNDPNGQPTLHRRDD